MRSGGGTGRGGESGGGGDFGGHGEAQGREFKGSCHTREPPEALEAARPLEEAELQALFGMAWEAARTQPVTPTSKPFCRYAGSTSCGLGKVLNMAAFITALCPTFLVPGHPLLMTSNVHCALCLKLPAGRFVRT